jgi:hypothetical protein
MQTRIALHVILHFDIKCAGLPSHQEFVLTALLLLRNTHDDCAEVRQPSTNLWYLPVRKIKRLRLARQSAWVAPPRLGTHLELVSFVQPCRSGRARPPAKRAISAPPIFCNNVTSVLHAWNGHAYILSVFIRSSWATLRKRLKTKLRASALFLPGRQQKLGHNNFSSLQS